MRGTSLAIGARCAAIIAFRSDETIVAAERGLTSKRHLGGY